MINTIRFVIRPKAPFDFHLTVRRLHGVNHEMYREESGKLLRTLRLDGRPVLVQLNSIGRIEDPVLAVEAAGQDLSSGDEARLQRLVGRLISADVDLHAFYKHFEREERLSDICRDYYGLRIMLEGSLFECMVKTIIGQQMNLSFAAALNRRLIERTSDPFLFEGRSYPVFPQAEDVARLDYAELTQLQFSRRKAEYVIDFARLAADGSLDLESLYDTSDADVITRLCALRGIGRWTAECFLLFGMGRRDLLPAADIGLRNALKREFGLDGQPSEEEVRRIGAAWSPWSSYMTFYLWESLNHPKSPAGETAGCRPILGETVINSTFNKKSNRHIDE